MTRKNKVRTNIVELPVSHELVKNGGRLRVRQDSVCSEVHAMLGCYAKWLNQFAPGGVNELEGVGIGVTEKVSYEDYWEEDLAGAVVDMPVVVLDSRWGNWREL